MKKRSLPIILLLSFSLLLSACGISGTTTTATGSNTDTTTTPGEAVTTDTAASDTGTAETHAFITSFIAVGDAGTIIYSDDGGGTWIPAASGTYNNLISIGYGDGRTVAVGEDGVILYSDNGSEWSGAGTVPEIPGNLNGVAYGNGTWIAVGDRGVTSGTIVKSADGDTWVSVPSVIKQNLNSVAYANGLWVAVGNNGTVIHSTDGETWTPAASVTENHLNAVAYGGEIWVAVGNGVIIVSPDGYNWYVPDDIGGLLHTGDLYTAVAYGSGNGLWVGVGYNFIRNIGIILNDYVNDYVYTMPGTAFAGVAYGSGPWVAVGTSGTILRSDDGTAWARVTSGTNANLAAVAKVERRFEYAVDFSAASTTADPSVCESITGIPWPFGKECVNVGAVWVLESLANKALPSLADTEFTIEAMIRSKTAYLNGGIFAYYDSGGVIMWVKNNVPKFGIRIPTAGLTPDSSNQYIVVGTSAAAEIAGGNWTHVAGVLVSEDHSTVHAPCSAGDGSESETPHLDIYINGRFEDCASTGSQFAVDPTYDLNRGRMGIGQLIATKPPGYGDYFKTDFDVDGLDITTRFEGIIDEVRLWTVARTAEEISTCWNKELGIAGPCARTSDLKGYWRFDENTGSVIYDYSGNAFNGSKNEVAVLVPISHRTGVLPDGYPSTTPEIWNGGWVPGYPF